MSRAVDLGVPTHARPAWDTLQERIRRAHGTPCAGSDRDDWTGGPAGQRRAAEACLDCPVMDACTAYAEAAGEPFGTWGGRTASERATRREVTA